MNFEFSPEELALQEQARRFFAAQGILSLNRELLDGRGVAQAGNLWRQVAELGWPAAAIPESYGGVGLGRVVLCALAEEVGRAAAPLPLMSSVYLAAEALLIAGNEAQKQCWLPRLASGELIGTMALAGHFTVNAGRLSGEVAPVPYVGNAALAIVSAKGAESDSGLFIIDLRKEGVQLASVATIDDSMPSGRLRLAAVPGERLGTVEDTQRILDEVRRRAAVLIAFEQVGGAEACIEMAITYALERRSFGKLIGSYQAIKYKLVDMYIRKELARSNAYYAAWALAKEAPELELAASTARVSAIDAYEYAAAENIQIHGGIGFTWQADCQIHYRRSRLWAHALGVKSEWQSRLISAIDSMK